MTQGLTMTHIFEDGLQFKVHCCLGCASIFFPWGTAGATDRLHMALGKSDIDALPDEELVTICRGFAADYEKNMAQIVALNTADEERRAKTRTQENDKLTKKDRSGYVYLLHCDYGDGSVYKIGKTTGDPHKRAEQINTASPVDVELVGAIHCNDATAFERELHNRLASLNVKGEWYRLPPETVTTFKGEEGYTENV